MTKPRPALAARVARLEPLQKTVTSILVRLAKFDVRLSMERDRVTRGLTDGEQSHGYLRKAIADVAEDVRALESWRDGMGTVHEALPWADEEDTDCGAEDDEWACTLIRGHEGDHVAGNGDGHTQLHRWPAKPAAKPPERPVRGACISCDHFRRAGYTDRGVCVLSPGEVSISETCTRWRHDQAPSPVAEVPQCRTCPSFRERTWCADCQALRAGAERRSGDYYQGKAAAVEPATGEPTDDDLLTVCRYPTQVDGLRAVWRAGRDAERKRIRAEVLHYAVPGRLVDFIDGKETR